MWEPPGASRETSEPPRPPSSSPTPGICEIRLRRGRRPAERRKVDAGERDLRDEGGDRLGQAADDAPPDPRDLHDRRRTARVDGHPGLPEAARPDDGAYAADG